MNERIKELAVEAGNYAYKMNPEEDSYGRPANPRKFQQDRDTKFAELLIVKCANIIWHEADMKDSTEINEGGYKILEHFGIDWTTK